MEISNSSQVQQQHWPTLLVSSQPLCSLVSTPLSSQTSLKTKELREASNLPFDDSAFTKKINVDPPIALPIEEKSDHTYILDERKYLCNLCGFMAASKGSLNQHIQYIHTTEKKYNCTRCEFKSRQKNDLKRHVDTVHNGIKQFFCSECGYQTGKKSNLKIIISLNYCTKG